MTTFLKHASIYGFANLLLQVGQFLLLPLYLRCLSPADYGLLELATRCAETAGTVLLFGGFRQALMSFHQQADSELARRRVVCSVVLLYVLAALVGGVLALALVPWLGLLLGVPKVVLQLALLLVLTEPLLFVPQTLQQARVQSGAYLIAVLGHFALRVVLCLVLVRYADWGVAGVLAGNLIAALLFGVLLTGRELARGWTWPTLSILRGLLGFALPMLPGGLCFFLLHQGDRLFLLHHASPAEIGTYALGYNLAMTVSRFSFLPLFMVWSARMYEVAKRPDAPDLFGEATRRLLLVYGFGGLGVCLFGSEVIHLLGGEAYAEAAQYIPLVFLACLIQAGATLLDAGFYIRRRTSRKLAVTLISAIAMVGLYGLLIPPYGAWGAALATLAGFSLLTGLTWLATRRLFPVRQQVGRLLGALVLGLGVWCLATQVPLGWLGLLARVGLWLGVLPLAWVFGLISDADKQQLLALVSALTGLPWGRLVSTAGEPVEAVPPSSASPLPASLPAPSRRPSRTCSTWRDLDEQQLSGRHLETWPGASVGRGGLGVGGASK